MEHLITRIIESTNDLDKNRWRFQLPNGTVKSFAELENEDWELAAISNRHWIWKRKQL